MHMAPLRPVPIARVLVMENGPYYAIRHRRGIWR